MIQRDPKVLVALVPSSVGNKVLEDDGRKHSGAIGIGLISYLFREGG